MSRIDRSLVQHYTHGRLDEAIDEGLRQLGREPGEAHPDDLAPIDEFHTGGRQATAELAEQLRLAPGMAVLDIGSGIGGTARFLAQRYDCAVTGVDLTPEYVAVAGRLSELVKLSDRVAFYVGDATDLPCSDGSFDVATVLHVGMNVADKGRLAGEAARVLRPGGTLAIYDMMRVGDGDLDFPVPWASQTETSFVATPADYRSALEAVGFAIEGERNRRDFALDFFAAMKVRLAEKGPPPLGLHILMGAEAPAKIANVIRNIERNRIAPVEMICRREQLRASVST